MNTLNQERQILWVRTRRQEGSVLMVAMMTITILTMICATSLYVTSQNSSTGVQTAAWQQSLTGAEAGVDLAVEALNNNKWGNWKSVTSGSLPSAEPSPAPATAAAGPPDSSHYNILLSSAYPLTMPTPCEGATVVSNWVTIDTAGMLPGQDTLGSQWYRIRSTGQSNLQTPTRVSANKIDSDLRNTIAFKTNRKYVAGSTLNTLGPSRTIEVLLQPLTSALWGRGVTCKNAVTISGSGIIDSFNSGDPFHSLNGLYQASTHLSHGDIGMLDSTGADMGSQYVYGGIAYSGPTVRNTGHVQGTISTPFNVTIPPTSDPTGTFGALNGSPPPTTLDATGSSRTSPLMLKVNGDFQLSGSNTMTITGPPGSYITVWVTGQWATSGSSQIIQSPNVHVTWYVDSQIAVSGDSYNNQGGRAENVSFVGVSTNSQVGISGSSTFIGTINAPGYKVNISGTGALSGAVVAKTLSISGGASLHYDQALAGPATPAIGNYAFASWFEDNGVQNRGITY